MRPRKGDWGRTQTRYTSDYFTREGIPFRPFDVSEDDHLEALLDGEIDATLLDHAYAVERLKEYEGRLAIVGPSILLDRGIGIGVRENDGLKSVLDEALASMKADGSLNALIVKWFGEEGATFEP